VARLNAETPNVAIAQNSNEADIAMAKTQLIDAQAGLDAAEHDRQGAASRLVESQATAKRDQMQADRYKQLFDKEETSRQEYENYVAAAQASNARLAASQSALASAEKVVQQRKAQLDSQTVHLAEVTKNAPHALAMHQASAQSQKAGVDLAHADLDQSQLNLSYAHIAAPVTGVITGRSAEPGNHVQQGEQLLMIVDTSNLWVTADFKETQLRLMHPGCKAEVKVDALGRTYEGVVESMPGITGSRSSVLPPENATGNYVKVIQRLPVRIALKPGQPQMNELRPGMSVEAKVSVR
jgi:membrane fusion protein (multidrug efflux system)